jgi:hypothetical protein
MELFATPVDVVATGKFSLNINGSLLSIPYSGNLSLDASRNFITRAVLMIHGTNRNANDYYVTTHDVVSRINGESDSTIVIAPQYLQEEDINRHNPGIDYLFWSDAGGWKTGSKSLSTTGNPRPERISSFAVLDSLLLRIVRNNPNLRNVVIAGHSAGGQFVNRFTAASPAITTIHQQYSVSVRSIIANPSSYLYMDDKRRIPGTPDQFETPATACSTYNEYKYGLNSLYSYLDATGATQIRKQYAERDVVYLLGGADTTTTDGDLDISCEAMLQGGHRFERGTVFYNYLQYYYGGTILQRHSKVIVDGVGHDNYDMFNSANGVDAIMNPDMRHLSTQQASNPTTEVWRPSISAEPNPFNPVVKIKVNAETDRKTIIYEVLSSDGKRVLSQKAGSDFIWNASSLPAGIYMVKVHVDRSTVMHKKIILIK